ncbi:MAG: cation-translocating P-type ATPase [bacterium]
MSKFDATLVVLLLLAIILRGFGGDPSSIIGTVSDYSLFITAILGTAPVLYSAYKALINRKISVDLLASVALIFSLFTHEWLSAVFINLMLASARVFMSYNEARARKNIDGLLKLKPTKIKVERGGKMLEVQPAEVMIGDFVLVDLGERVPVDGEVVAGTADVDQSALTGESLPVSKEKGDKVWSSTLISSGHLTIKAEKVGTETTLEKIIEMVENAQLEKPDVHTAAEKFATWYLVTVFIGAILLFLFGYDIKVILAIMLVVCADDVAVAVPLTFLTAISYCAKKGAIVKGASYLEALAQVKVIFVDKTGTLTKGNLKVEKFECAGITCEDFVSLAKTTAEQSDHPISKAILEYANGNYNSTDEEVKSTRELPGKGVLADIGNKKVILGRPSFAREFGFVIDKDLQDKIWAEEDKGFNVTVVGVDGKIMGYFVLADELKANIAENIAELKKLGVEKVIMLTGDNERVAKRLAQKLGVTDFYPNLLPEQKLAYIKNELNSKYKVAMVGDGVNDAASLSLADVGIAMGGIGMDVAIESADIVLMKDDFSKIAELMRVSKYTLKIANQDFWIWGASNIFGLGLVFFAKLAPTGASLYNFLTDFLPLINSVRIFSLYIRR